MIDQAKSWCIGKSCLWRAPILVWFGFVLAGYLKNPSYGCVLSGLNLGIHEFGHLMFSWAPQFFGILGGTLVQLAAPVFGLWNFYRQDDFFAMTLCFGWLSTNLFEVARYMADARIQALDLVSPFGSGDSIIHDWNYLFSHTGLLNLDVHVAAFTRLLAVLSMLVCLSSGSWLLWHMLGIGRTDAAV